MNKKTLIQLGVVAVCLLLSGVVLYKGLFQKEKPVLMVKTAIETESVPKMQKILPVGNTLDFKILNKQGLRYGQITYPKLDLKEVGVKEDEIIHSLSAPNVQ